MSKEDGKQGNVYVVEPIELSSESDPSELEDMDDLDQIKTDALDIQQLDRLIETTKQKEQERTLRPEDTLPAAEAKDVRRQEVIDDFIRNFLIRNKMNKTLTAFQQQWYEIVQKGRQANTVMQVPDAYIENQTLRQEIESVKGQLDKAVIVAQKAKATYDKLLKERDFHKMHHQRVQQEKKKLNGDIQKLKNLHIEYEKKYDELTEKYTHVMKQKMLLKLERDRLKAKAQLQKPVIPPINEPVAEQKMTSTSNLKKMTPFPEDQRPNPYQSQHFDPYPYKQSVLYKTYPGHMMAITRVAFHPKKAIIGTASDDYTWKIWTVPNGQLIMSGQGHKDWVSGIAFHPKGLHIVTSSGDSTVKVWDFVNTTCTHTFKDHIQPVWSVAVHDTGDFAATASMDHNSKLFDLNAGRSRHTFRGHVDSVNHVAFQPFSNILCTSSADKTVSLWDIKTGLCVQTFYGHLNSVNHAQFNLRGDTIASCDADGVVKVWDVRMVKQRQQYDSGPYSANAVTFDKSSSIIAVASDEGVVKLFNDTNNKLQHTLKGHEDAVQDVIFDFNSKMIVTCGSDSTFRIWQ